MMPKSVGLPNLRLLLVLAVLLRCLASRQEVEYRQGYSIGSQFVTDSKVVDSKCLCWHECQRRSNCTAVTVEEVQVASVKCNFTERHQLEYKLQKAVEKITYLKVQFWQVDGVGDFYVPLNNSEFDDAHALCPTGSRLASFDSNEAISKMLTYFDQGKFPFNRIWMDMKWSVELNAMMTPEGEEVPTFLSLWYREEHGIGDDRTCMKFRCDSMESGKKIYYIINSVSTYSHRPLCMKI